MVAGVSLKTHISIQSLIWPIYTHAHTHTHTHTLANYHMLSLLRHASRHNSKKALVTIQFPKTA